MKVYSQAALQRASAGRTTVVIAHRLSTIRDVSRVYVIKEGRVVEEGGEKEMFCIDAHHCDLKNNRKAFCRL